MNVLLAHETEEALRERLKAAGGEARPEIWRKLTAHAKIRLCEAFESTSACLRAGARVEESIDPGEKTPQDRTSGERGVPGEVPSFMRSDQWCELRKHGIRLSGGYEAFMSAQDGARMSGLKQTIIFDRPRSRGPVEMLPPEFSHLEPEALEKARELEKKFEELLEHGVHVGSLSDFLQANGIKIRR